MKKEITIRTVGEVAVDMCDASSDFLYESLSEDDPRKRRPGIAKVRHLLDWESEVLFKRDFGRTLQYFRTHERLVLDDAPSPASDDV